MHKYNSIVDRVTYWGNILISISVLLELIFFSSLPNFAGCVMTIICWTIYKNIGLKEHIIKRHVFAWLVYTSMSLYRILPLIATLVEFKPITYKFELPYETFFWETILYIVSSAAFYFAIFRSKRNPNFIQRILNSLDLYKEPSEKLIWILGLIGFVATAYILFTVGGSQYLEFGDAGNKFLSGFRYLSLAPILLMFPSLYKQKNPDHRVCVRDNLSIAYTLIYILICFATNSRQSILAPIGTFIILFLLSIIKTRTDYRKIISTRNIVVIVISMVVILPIITDISDAMLISRSIRTEVSQSELLKETLEIFNDKEQLNRFRASRGHIFGGESEGYADEWTDEYVSNFALNRYCNLRMTDMTLYHANRIGYSNETMRKAFFDRLAAILPSPVLRSLNIDIDKSEIVNAFSRGDLLYALSSGADMRVALRVTSHVADGLATFGLWYFPFQFILFYIQFLLVDCFLITEKRKTTYSLLGLITIFTFLALFRNAQGCLGDAIYIIRLFIQTIFMYLIVYSLLKITKI